jgi:predicted Fe-Mo cluster-binding NifX family protein
VAGTEVADIPSAMRIAIPIWNDRVSPVFDVSRSIRVADIIDGTVIHQADHALGNASRASKLVEIGVDTLICAGISTPLEATLWVSGIEVISDTCGAAEEIINAFASGDIEMLSFRSPGCGCGGNTKRNLSHHRKSARVLR